MTIVDSADRQYFLENGYLKIKNFMIKDDLSALNKIVKKLLEEESLRKHFFDLGGKGRYEMAIDNPETKLLQILGPGKLVPELRDLRIYKRAKEVAEFIFQDNVTLREHMIFKPASYGCATPWHQDQSYHNHEYIYRNINFWIPLQDTPIESGCLHFYPKSHIGNKVLPHHWHENNIDNNATEVDNPEQYFNSSVACPLKLGDASLHHSYMLHYAKENTTNVNRRALIIVAQAPAIKKKNSKPFPWYKDKGLSELEK